MYEAPVLDVEATAALCEEVKTTLHDAQDAFEAYQQIARWLGGQRVDAAAGDDPDLARFGFWAPQLDDHGVSPGDVHLELLDPMEPLHLDRALQKLPVRRTLIPLKRVGATWWAVVRGARAGCREEVGIFYRLRYRDRSGDWHTTGDPLATSLPFGPFAPAELYDTARMHEGRRDMAWFERQAERGTPCADGIPRLPLADNLLEIHVGTATRSGTVAGLARRYAALAEKITEHRPLSPDDEVLMGYDGVQLMPLHCVVRDEAAPDCWAEPPDADEPRPVIEVTLRRPATTNWGYDVLISGCAAPNPAILESRRPDEVVDLACVLHTFPGRALKLVFDVVFGHADNQAIDLLPRHYFLGPNMYGQDMQYRDPAVRAILLELQRRLVDLGADGVRVDGAQDFKLWDPSTRTLRHDDAFLRSMSDIVNEVGGVQYRPWMIFEDGRPWPREDWELASSYRDVIADQPHAWQWGPLTFAHNTPFLFTFWISKWWRIQEIVTHGDQWISGVANHDTVRRGTQVSRKRNINTRLGPTLPAVLDHAYDHGASSLLFHGLLPGTPMDFLNATMRASWGFVRNTDERYAIKVVAEEASFLDWQVDDTSYAKVGRFRRLKELGFERLDTLRAFMRVLLAAVEATEFDPPAIAAIVRAATERVPDMPEARDVPTLQRIARAFMDDLHEYCNITHYIDELDPLRTRFHLHLREFRLARPWLRQALRPNEFVGHGEPAHRTVVFYGMRVAPDEREQIVAVMNMEGEAVDIVPADLPIPRLPRDGWRLLLSTPRTAHKSFGAPTKLRDAEGLLYVRQVPPGARAE